MALLLSVEKEDGTVLEDSLEIIRLSTDQGRKVHLTKGDVLVAFHLHYKPRRKFSCLHFQKKHTRIWGKARVTTGSYEGAEMLTVAALK